MRELIIGIRSALTLWVLTALLYPALILLVGLVFPYQAHGSLITNEQGQVVGSALIGQSFSEARYFVSRPSTTNYSSFTPAERDPANVGQRTGVSGASNLAPSNTAELLKDERDQETPDLLARIRGDVEKLQQAGIQPTADLVYTSGSSLDPHISPEAAQAQVEQVAQARSLAPNQVNELIVRNTDGRFFGIFGEPGVNVLKLNLALDALEGRG